ncbi:MAG: peptide chain release factor 3 [Deltaproteobacteria bacterium]|nr:peptide chain release factor 3 [Deltaproteobacteria bacterium]
MDDQELMRQVNRRKTFAIISHPDAGKTTLTEKLLLYGGAIQMAGSVKARRARQHAVSDWMEIEKERGISVTSSVMQFPYRGFQLNLLDTPGHQDFGEDTYRTLHAADCAIMLIDNNKGVEAQTRKLFEVCRRRRTPIFTFVNKCDRLGRDPFEIVDEVEQVLGIRCIPSTWPVRSFSGFKGVYDRMHQRVVTFESGLDHGASRVETHEMELNDAALDTLVGEEAAKQAREEVELLDGASGQFDLAAFNRGELSPVFFGSAMNNFGVEPFLDEFIRIGPTPAPRIAGDKVIDPVENVFRAFVFKIQANMDRAHRDRLAFMRIVSGRFERGMRVWHVREEREIRLNSPQVTMAQERVQVDEAFAGDVIGIIDPGMFQIGDTLTEGERVAFEGIPRFSPEHFTRLRLKDPLKRKQLQQGLQQLALEGTVQVFHKAGMTEKDAYLGAVGQLQFEVFKHRMATEYRVEVILDALPYSVCRWVQGDLAAAQKVAKFRDGALLEDHLDRPLVLLHSERDAAWAEREVPDAKLTPVA